MNLNEPMNTIEKLKSILNLNELEVGVIIHLSSKEHRKSGLSRKRITELLKIDPKEIQLELENLEQKKYICRNEKSSDVQFTITDLLLNDFHHILSEHLEKVKKEKKKTSTDIYDLYPFLEDERQRSL